MLKGCVCGCKRWKIQNYCLPRCPGRGRKDYRLMRRSAREKQLNWTRCEKYKFMNGESNSRYSLPHFMCWAYFFPPISRWRGTKKSHEGARAHPLPGKRRKFWFINSRPVLGMSFGGGLFGYLRYRSVSNKRVDLLTIFFFSFFCLQIERIVEVYWVTRRPNSLLVLFRLLEAYLTKCTCMTVASMMMKLVMIVLLVKRSSLNQVDLPIVPKPPYQPPVRVNLRDHGRDGFSFRVPFKFSYHRATLCVFDREPGISRWHLVLKSVLTEAEMIFLWSL